MTSEEAEILRITPSKTEARIRRPPYTVLLQTCAQNKPDFIEKDVKR
ncbi:MAG: hypothetical protein ACE14S_05980 [Candidatus Bathyarchaeia archaeon]